MESCVSLFHWHLFGLFLIQNETCKNKQGTINDRLMTYSQLVLCYIGQGKVRVIWCLIVVGFLLCLYDTHYWTFGAPNSSGVSAVVYALSRVLWSVTVGSVICLCHSGNATLVDRLLSWSAFTPLSRLTYSVYLTHVWIVWTFWASIRSPIPLNPLSMFSIICYTIFFSHIFGFCFALLFECPINYFQIYLKNLIGNKNLDR